MRIGTIKKVICSNKKIVVLDICEDSLDINAKSAGKTKITVIGSNYTYTINLTIKKLAVTAKFYKKLPDGNYLIQIANHTKEGFFNSLNFTLVFRSSSGKFIDWIIMRWERI